jgi:multicomponent Na+:H+ antiporter subunit D
VLPAVARGADTAARRFIDAGAATAASSWSALGAGLGVLGCVVAAGVAAAGLPQWPPAVRRTAGTLTAPALSALRAAHSGHIGDYLAWMFAALAALAAAVATPLT